MKKSETLDLTGYVLSMNNKENSIDIQFYQPLPDGRYIACLLYTSPSPRDGLLSRMPSSA